MEEQARQADRIKVEIACNNYNACVSAYKGGADRIELFENLHEGGCTPSFGLIKKVKENIPLPIYVMIRPRGGHFVYDNDEFEIMRSDINTCRVLAVDGIVFGALTPKGEVDVALCARLLDAWKNKAATFHRAIDRSFDIHAAMEKVHGLGFERVLSSGGFKTVDEGKLVLRQMQQNWGDKIIVMPGSGVTPHNAKDISTLCGTKEIHATCKGQFNADALNANPLFEDHFPMSDEQIVRELVQSLGA